MELLLFFYLRTRSLFTAASSLRCVGGSVAPVSCREYLHSMEGEFQAQATAEADHVAPNEIQTLVE